MPGTVYWSRDQHQPVGVLSGKPEKAPPSASITPLCDHYHTLVELIYRCSNDDACVVMNRDVLTMIENSFQYVPDVRVDRNFDYFFGESESVGYLNYYPRRHLYVCPENPVDIIYIFEESDWEHSCEIHVKNMPLW